MPLTDARLQRHIDGGVACGVTQIEPGASTTRIAAFDMDSHKGETPWSDMQDVALGIMAHLERGRLCPIPFRSTGGSGMHIYLLWDEPQDAHSVRVALRAVLAACGLAEGKRGVAAREVEIFPKQSRVAMDACGSMLVLPLAGKSVPLDAFELDDMPREYVAEMPWPVSAAVPHAEPELRPAAASVDIPIEFADLQSALDTIPNAGRDELDYDDWWKVVAGIHHATQGSDAGLALAHAFSARSSKYGPQFLDERVWPYIGKSDPEQRTPITFGTIRHMAAARGWQDPSRQPSEDDFEVVAASEALARELPKFQRDKSGAILATIENVHLALAAPEVAGAEIGFDLFRDELMLTPPGEVAWRSFSDADYTRLRIRLERGGFKPVGREMIRDAVSLVGDEHQFDSAMLWLNRLPHDGASRCERFMETYFGVPDSPYARAVSLYLWTALAGRVLEPGVKADMVPVLVGLQGVRKSETLIAMVPHPDHYIEVALDERDDTASRKMRGALIGEIAELRGLQTREIEAVKAFITRRHEKWVPKFKEFAVTFPRRLVFVGTSNSDDILTDDTGNRRWLPIHVNVVDTAAVARDRDLLWAEARELFKATGVQWQAAQTLAQAEHESFSVAAADAWLPVIEHWLDVPDGFDSEATPRDREFLTIADVAQGALQVPLRALKRADEMRIGKILRILGYDRRPKRVNGQLRKAWFPVA